MTLLPYTLVAHFGVYMYFVISAYTRRRSVTPRKDARLLCMA